VISFILFVIQLNSNSVSIALFGYVKWWNVKKNKKNKKQLNSCDTIAWLKGRRSRKVVRWRSNQESEKVTETDI